MCGCITAILRCRTRSRVRQQCTVKSPLLLSTLIISLYISLGSLYPVANPDQYFRCTASFVCHNFANNCNSCIAFHLSIILDTVLTKFTGMTASFERTKNLFNLKNIMTKKMYLSWYPYFILLYMPWNFYRKILNVLLQNLMRMEHFEICTFKLI